VESCAGRVRVEVADREKARLDGPLPGLCASVWVAPRTVHLLVDRRTMDSAGAAAALLALCAR
jgi:hypothetical protein